MDDPILRNAARMRLVYDEETIARRVRELAADAGVNPNTMQRSLSQLESEGLAVSNRTAGRMVTEDAAVIDAARRKMAREIISTFFAAMADLGIPRERAIELLKEEGIHE